MLATNVTTVSYEKAEKAYRKALRRFLTQKRRMDRKNSKNFTVQLAAGKTWRDLRTKSQQDLLDLILAAAEKLRPVGLMPDEAKKILGEEVSKHHETSRDKRMKLLQRKHRVDNN